MSGSRQTPGRRVSLVCAPVLSTRLQRQHDLFHNPVGFAQDFDDPLIVHHVIERQRPALAVFQPFLRRLISTDVKFPRDLRHVVEILVGVNVDTSNFILPIDL